LRPQLGLDESRPYVHIAGLRERFRVEAGGTEERDFREREKRG